MAIYERKTYNSDVFQYEYYESGIKTKKYETKCVSIRKVYVISLE